MFLKAMPMSYSLILLLAVAGDALPFGPSRSRDLGIVDSYMQDLHESAVKEITAHRYDANGSLPSSSSSDRYLQIKNPCGYVKLSEIEETYRTATGVAFECSCQAYGFSDQAKRRASRRSPSAVLRTSTKVRLWIAPRPRRRPSSASFLFRVTSFPAHEAAESA